MSKRKQLTSDKARFAIASVIDGKLTANEIGRLMDSIEKTDGAKAVIDAYVKLMDYVIPKLSRVEHAGHDGGALTVDHVLKQVAKQGGSSELPAIDGEIVAAKPQLQPVLEHSLQMPVDQPNNSMADSSKDKPKPNTRGF